jgi:hypothetical protein
VLLRAAPRGLLRGAIECEEAGVAEHLEPGRMTTLYRALSADFTGQGWPDPELHGLTPYTPAGAGVKLAALAGDYGFAFFEYWLTDYVGHRGTLDEARALLATFDAVLGGLLAAWDDAHGLIVITSDHGNLEDLGHRHHTLHRVPTLVIGADRAAFAEGVSDLTHLAPAIERYLLAP